MNASADSNPLTGRIFTYSTRWPPMALACARLSESRPRDVVETSQAPARQVPHQF